SKLWQVYRPFRKPIFIGIVCVMILNAVQVIMPYVSGDIINTVLEKESYKALLAGLALVALLEFLSFIISLLKERNETNKIDFDLSKAIRNRTSRFLLGLSMGQHHNEHSGVKQSV